MNCYELLKTRTLDFTKVMVENYYALGLTETDALILIRLESQLVKGATSITVACLTPTMTIDDMECSDRIIALVNKGFIDYTLDPAKHETYSLDGTYRKLAQVLDDQAHEAHEESKDSEIAATVALLEREFAKQLSALEVELVRRWYKDDHYTADAIEKAILKAKRARAHSVKYVDAVLAKGVMVQEEKTVTDEERPDVVALFNDAYRSPR